MESKREVAWFTVALLCSCTLGVLVQRGLSESNLVWLEVFGGVTATVLLFIYRDTPKLPYLSKTANPTPHGE